MTARSVRAESHRVIGSAQLGFVLGMAGQAAQLGHAVRELALVAILAHAELFERSTQLGLVAGSVDGVRAW